MRAAIALTGQTFDRLYVLGEFWSPKERRRICVVRCACGTRKRVAKQHLKDGRIRSCGCIKKGMPAAPEIKLVKFYGIEETE